MMSLPSAATTHLQGDTITIAFYLDITKVDNTHLRITSHVDNITIAGNDYESSTGADASSIKLTNNMAVGGGDVAMLITSPFLTEADILAGKYNGAAYELGFVDYTAPDAWKVSLQKGVIGEVKIEGGQFTAELRSLAQKLNRIIGEYYQPGCRAQLGDSRCTVNLAPFTYSGTVTALTDANEFTGTPIKATNFFKYGRVHWLTGDNAGLISEIKASGSAGQVQLFLDVGMPIQLGDTYQIIEGCDKNFATCKNKFSNQNNFRGEPHIPGIEKSFITRL